MEDNSHISRRVTTTIVWNLWLERNRGAFSNTAFNLGHYIYCIINEVLLWSAAFGDTGKAPHVIPSKNTAASTHRSLQEMTEASDGTNIPLQKTPNEGK